MAIINLGRHASEHPMMRALPPYNVGTLPTDPTTHGNMTNGPLHTSPMPMNRDPLPQPEAASNPSAHDAAGDRPRPAVPSDPSQVGVPVPLAETGTGIGESPETPGTASGDSTGPAPLRYQHHPLRRRHVSADEILNTPPTPIPRDRKSFASHIASKERDLGLVCASPECPYEGDRDREREDGREPITNKQETVHELLVVRSPSPFTSSSRSGSPDTPAAAPAPATGVQKACAHKWHRDCLKKCQTLGDTESDGDGNGDGKTWIKCGVCKAKGWIAPRDDTRSEGEVEKLVQWS